MAEEQGQIAGGVCESENAGRNEVQSEQDRNVGDVGETDENAVIIGMLEEVKRVVRELESERRATNETMEKMIGQNHELARRLNSIESERNAERLRVVDLEIRLDMLERRVGESTIKLNGVLEQMSVQFESPLDKLNSYKADIRKEYLEQFAENFEAILVAVEEIDQRVQNMETKYKERVADLHNLSQTERDEQKTQSALKNASQAVRSEQKSPLALKYSNQREENYSVNEAPRKASAEHEQRCDKTRTVPQKPIQQPPKYDGKTSWEAFSAQFDIAARMNGWTDEDKAAFLATSLQGNATLILSSLSEQDRRNYTLLVAALTSRFGVTHQSELARAKLKNRVKKKDETLPELVEGIENLTRTAYPDASQELQDVLARDHFIDALTDEDLRLRIRQAKPQSLQRALETALELESFQLASKHRNRILSGSLGHVRMVEEDVTGPSARARLKKVEEKEGRLEKLEATINELIKEIKTQSRRRRRRRSPTDKRNWSTGDSTCWTCGEVGHFSRECKHNVKEEVGEKKKENQGGPPKRVESGKQPSGNGQWSG